MLNHFCSKHLTSRMYDVTSSSVSTHFEVKSIYFMLFDVIVVRATTTMTLPIPVSMRKLKIKVGKSAVCEPLLT